MGIVIYKILQLFLLTFAIGFFIAFIIKVLMIVIQSTSRSHASSNSRIKCYYRAVRIRRIRNKNRMHDTNNSNDLIRFYYGSDSEDSQTAKL
ncbi:MAG: hypothetical protein HXX14_05060 [Bacteroidetes bacterium]|nr:hypothetical protein [Bacteroidota bacterium]